MRLISLNVERSRHLDKVLPFLKKLNPDVVCVQELHETDISLFEDVIGSCRVSAPNCWHTPDIPGMDPQIMETAIFSKHPSRALPTHYYAGSRANALKFPTDEFPAKEFIEDHCLVGCDIAIGNDDYRFMTTHFTWSYGGEATDLQRENMRKLLWVLGKSSNFVLTGDFNAPRKNPDGTPGEIFSELSTRFRDNVPLRYETSIDVNLHRVGKSRGKELANKMVDGLFTTPRYVASNVELVFGVSDHAAIVADISKV